MEVKNKKVGMDYVRKGDTRKRPIDGIVWNAIWGLFILAYAAFLINMIIDTGFVLEFSKDCFAIILACSLPMLTFVMGFLCTFRYNKHERIIEFKIHEYERWNWKMSEYEKFYMPERVCLRSTYFSYKHIGDELEEYTPEEVKQWLTNKSDDFPGYKTQNEAMMDILGVIRRMISRDKAAENVKVRNVKTLEVFSVKDLKEQVAKFDTK